MDNINLTPDGQPMLLQKEAEVLGNHLVANYGEMSGRVAQLIAMMGKNDPNVTLIHAVATLTLMRLLFDNAGPAAVEQWGVEMEQMCGSQFPFRPDTLRKKAKGPAGSTNPLLAGNDRVLVYDDDEEEEEEVDPFDDKPDHGYAKYVRDPADSDAIAEAKRKAHESLKNSGPDKGAMDWGKTVSAPAAPKPAE